MKNQTQKQTQCLYNGTVNLIFYPESHRYRLEGERTYLTSVTSATGIIDKSRSLMAWAVGLAGTYLRDFLEKSKATQFSTEELLPVIDEAIREYNVVRDKAAEIGNITHDIAQEIGETLRDGGDLKLVLKDIQSRDLDERVQNGLIAFINWVVEHDVKFLECERMLYSKKHKYVGLTDAIIKMGNKTYLVDYKTSKRVYDEMYYQLAGYTLAYKEELGTLDGQMIIHFDKETGEFAVHEIDPLENMINEEVFLACLKIREREKELARAETRARTKERAKIKKEIERDNKES